ncbi:MAG: cysteine synthase family protein [Anaerolineales bacterium]|nr:cysteine synthase family protein [Anaerolineales bacterium]
MNILGQIGNTPLLKLNRVNDNPDVDIFVKCEFMNPGGSIKDRMALKMIEEAEQSGKLIPGGTIVDQSTGNTGPALSFVGAVKGYKVQLFLPSQLGSSYNPADRIRIAKLFGCKVIPIDLNEHIEDVDKLGPVERAAAFVAVRMKQCHDLQEREPLHWWANQLCNFDNKEAHREGTGQEILNQAEGKFDAWVASIGTGGTILGVAEALKEQNPDLIVAGVVPTDDPRLEWVRSRAVHRALERFGVPKMRFLIEDILEKNLLDQEMIVKNEDAKNMADRLCREEGLFCGMSSGANVWAAVELAKSMKKGSKIVTVLVDRRDRYFAEYPNEHYVV